MDSDLYSDFASEDPEDEKVIDGFQDEEDKNDPDTIPNALTQTPSSLMPSIPLGSESVSKVVTSKYLFQLLSMYLCLSIGPFVYISEY